MTEPWLLDACRSPIGKGHPEKGAYRDLRADDLAVQVLHRLLERTGIDPSRVEEFFLGCVGQHLEQGKNLARQIALLAGLPETVPGVTINRLCASSLSALQFAADGIRAGAYSLVLVGGVEHMGHVPMGAAVDYHPRLFEGRAFPWNHMGMTAEHLAQTFDIPRLAQESYALGSSARYFRAREAGSFAGEVVAIRLPDGGEIDRDEAPRRSTPGEMAALNPAFKPDGCVTAATSSPVADGAVMALVGAPTEALPGLARIGASATVGLDPALMGLGPVPAIRRLLERTGLRMDDIDLFEINEAFAVQVLACQRELGIPSDRLNVRGGALALGHPLGMSGLRIAASLAYALKERGLRRGIAAMCVGHGQGVAMLLDRRAS